MTIDYNLNKEMNQSLCKKDSIFQYVFSISIILLPLLYLYKGIGDYISFGELILIPFIIYFFVLKINNKQNDVNKWLLFFYILSLFTTILCLPSNYFQISNSLTIIIRMIYYGLLIFVSRSYFDFDKIWRIYLIFIFIFTSYLILQFIVFKSTNYYLPISLNYEWQFPPEAKTSDLALLYRWGFRPSSLFNEPSYFFLYICPGLVTLLFKKNSCLEWLVLLLCVISTILSTSSSGVYCILFLFFIRIFVKVKNNKYDIFFRLFILAIFIFLILMIIFINFNGILVTRLESGGSFNYRITRGWILYSKISDVNKIIGVGINNIDNYMLYYGIKTGFDESNLNYVCSVFSVLNSSGIIGLISITIFLVYEFKSIVKYSKNKRNVLFGFYITIVFILFYENILFSYRFAYLFIIFEGIKRSKILE